MLREFNSTLGLEGVGEMHLPMMEMGAGGGSRRGGAEASGGK